MSRIEKIYEVVLPMMYAEEVEDTLENRLKYLIDLRDLWLEDDVHSFGKLKYILTINLEISGLAIRILWNSKRRLKK